jgi:hypothetical protein
MLRNTLGSGTGVNLIHKGTRFLVLDDFDVTAMVHWRAPMTSGLRCTIQKGTVLVAFGDSVPILGSVSCVPEDSASFERDHVPEEIRNTEKFFGISFLLTRQEIRAHLKAL